MKKVFILFALLIGVFAFTKKGEASSEGVGIVTSGNASLNLRKDSSLSSTIIGKLSNNSYVEILGEQNNFYYVIQNGQYGYASKSYITKKDYKKATTLSNLNIRKSGSTSSSIIKTVSKDSSLYILSSSTYWSNVLVDGYVGYAYNTYLKSESSLKGYNLNLIDYKQYDSRWANSEIVSGKTMKQIGCLTTCFAMTESKRTGITTTPLQMMNKLSYTSSGDLYWPSNYKTTTSSDYLNIIYSNLSIGIPTIIGAKSSSSMHFVVVYGFSGSKISVDNFLIKDPGSSTRKTLNDFFKSYPTYYKLAYYS